MPCEHIENMILYSSKAQAFNWAQRSVLDDSTHSRHVPVSSNEAVLRVAVGKVGTLFC